MSENPAKEAITDLLAYVEMLETQTGAILRFLRDNGIVTDEKLAPYMAQAAVASDVKARAARARINHLFGAEDKAKPAAEAVAAPFQQDTQAAHQTSPDQKKEDQKKEDQGKDVRSAQQQDSARKERTESSRNTSSARNDNNATGNDPKKSASSQDQRKPSEIVAGKESLTDGENNPESQSSQTKRPTKVEAA